MPDLVPDPAPIRRFDGGPVVHDLGGDRRFRCEAIDRDAAPPDAFGQRVDALRQVLAARGLLTVDELRRGIEAIPEAGYRSLGYYEKWVRALALILAERGAVPAAVLDGVEHAPRGAAPGRGR